MSYEAITLEEKQSTLQTLRDIKTAFAARNWFPGTSGNLSMRTGAYKPEQFYFAITASGKDKSVNTPEDFLFVNAEGLPVEMTQLKPSAETLIHCEIYRQTGCGAIFHIHTVYNSIISEFYGDEGAVPLQGVELIKAFNIWTENAKIDVPIVPNFAHIPSIVPYVTEKLNAEIPGILLRNHGIYAWGANAFEAKRHLEAFEFLFEYAYRMMLLKR